MLCGAVDAPKACPSAPNPPDSPFPMAPHSRTASLLLRRRPARKLPLLALLVAISASVTTTPLLVSQQADAAIVERIVAVVGPRAILLTDLRERALPYLLHIYNTLPEGPQRVANISQVYKVILDQMINEELESTAAQDAGVVISEAQVDEALARTAAQNEISVNAVLAEAKRSGLSVTNYREELRRQLIQRTLVELRLRGRVRVTEQDIRDAYRRLVTEERMRATQRTQQLRIALGRTEAEQTSQRELAEKIADQARDGADFRDLIAEYSTDSRSGLRPQLPPMQEPVAVQRATMALEVGEVSKPVRFEGSWVIFHPNMLSCHQKRRSRSNRVSLRPQNDRDNRVAAIDFPLSKTTTPRLRFIAWFVAPSVDYITLYDKYIIPSLK